MPKSFWIAILLISAVLLFSGCVSEPESPTSILDEVPEQPTAPNDPYWVGLESIVSGTVLENDTGCMADAYCILRVKSENNAIDVVYDYGKNVNPCLNAISDSVIPIQRGAVVEVYGIFTKKDSSAQYTMSTCDSEDYYIQRA